MILEKSKRHIIPDNFELNKYEDIKPYLDDILNSEFNQLDDLINWIYSNSELDAFLSEDLAWRYINYTRYTNDSEKSKKYLQFVEEIQPHLVKVGNEITKKLVASAYFDSLPDQELINYKRNAKLQIELFREENIELETKESTLAQQYASIVGKMSIEHVGKELTLQQASIFLQSSDRKLREEIYYKVNERRIVDSQSLNELFNKLLVLRNQQAQNAGYDNYRDYKHIKMGRFDYSIQDVLNFHQSVKKVAVPIQKELLKLRKEKLGLEELRPYDTAVNIYASTPLKPFEKGEELIDKSITCFERLDPFFGECLKAMKTKGFLDVESRMGKAPGGYNYPLDENGLPFIFMNASGTMRDLTTMVHEGGHAVHSVLTRNLKVNDLKHCPSEVAELASMSMELFTMDHWDVFFDDKKDLIRAKIEQLEGVLDVLPWISTVDKFQQWLYTHPNHSEAERNQQWETIFNEFSSGLINYSGLEKYKLSLWHKQLHIFEVPFYYIEYGIAQLGAVALYKNYCENPTETISKYKEALSLGYTKTIPEIYKTAGIEFNFSEEYIDSLLKFIKIKWQDLVNQYEKL